MTIQEAIQYSDSLHPNGYDQETKISWLSDLDGRIFEEIINTHENGIETFTGYTTDTNTSTKLLVQEPYSNLYIPYLISKVDYYNAEISRYNNSSAVYNLAYQDFANWYNRTHMPKQKGVIKF